MEGESGATQSNIDELHSWGIQRDQLKVKVVVLEDSLMKFILRISKGIKWKVKMVILEVSFMNFHLRIWNEIKQKVKVVLQEV